MTQRREAQMLRDISNHGVKVPTESGAFADLQLFVKAPMQLREVLPRNAASKNMLGSAPVLPTPANRRVYTPAEAYRIVHG
jgi:hypothetical protein